MIITLYQIGQDGKIETRSDPGVLVAPGARHREYSPMRPDDTAPDGAVLIPLRRRDGSIRAYAIVDAVDAEWVNQWRWSLSEGYASRVEYVGGRKRIIRLHRALLGLTPGDGLEGDHRDRDRLNCCRSNLRPIPKFGNRQNHPGRDGSSEHRGVSWNKRRSKWHAYLMVASKQVTLGYFSDESDAAAAARNARLRLMSYATD